MTSGLNFVLEGSQCLELMENKDLQTGLDICLNKAPKKRGYPAVVKQIQETVLLAEASQLSRSGRGVKITEPGKTK